MQLPQFVAVPHLRDYLPDLPKYRNRFARTRVGTSYGERLQHYNQEIDDDEHIMLDIVRKKSSPAMATIRAGPRTTHCSLSFIHRLLAIECHAE
jgi:hypothetical protein